MIETHVEKYAGKGAMAHKISIGATDLYFSKSSIIAISKNGTLSITDEYLGQPASNHRWAIEGPLENRRESRMRRDVFLNYARDVLGATEGTRISSLARIDKFAGDGANAVALQVDNKKFYFSYDHLIAVRINGELTVSEDIWGKTVKRHIGILGVDPENRMPRAEFEEFADPYLAQFYVTPKVRWFRNVRSTR
jgi:hypothetical protein